MTVIWMTKSMLTHAYFAFWQQELLNVKTIVLRHNHTYLILDFYLFASYSFYGNIGNRDDILHV